MPLRQLRAELAAPMPAAQLSRRPAGPPSGWDPEDWVCLLLARCVLANRGLCDEVPAEQVRAAVRQVESVPQALRKHRMVGLVRRFGDLQQLPSDQRQQLADIDSAASLLCMRQASVAAGLHRTLSAAGVPALFLKGLFTSQLAWGDFAARGAGDLDVLVAAADLDVAISALVAVGGQFTAEVADPRLLAQYRLGFHAVNGVVDGLHLDLHHRPGPMPHQLDLGYEHLWRDRAIVSLGGQRLPTLAPRDALLHAAMHGCRDNWSSLRSVLDFVALASLVAPGWELGEIREHARAAHCLGPLEVGLAVAAVLVPDIPAQPVRARWLANWAWSRHRSGRMLRTSSRPVDVVSRLLFTVIAGGDAASIRFGVTHVLWLPSAMSTNALPPQLRWLYPVASPILVLEHLARGRSRGGSPSGSVSSRAAPGPR